MQNNENTMLKVDTNGKQPLMKYRICIKRGNDKTFSGDRVNKPLKDDLKVSAAADLQRGAYPATLTVTRVWPDSIYLPSVKMADKPRVARSLIKG